MVKLLKIIGRLIGITLEWLLIFVILFSFLIRFSPIQTLVAQQATDYLSTKLDVDVSIDKIAVIFPNEIALHGVYMSDENNDTLIACQSLYVDVGSYNMRTVTFKVGRVELDGGYTRLRFDENGRSNFSFIGEKFAKDTTTESKVKFDIFADEIVLNQTTFIYDDDRQTPTDFGVDYFHIRGDHINAVIENIKVSKYDYKAFIQNFSVKEKSGFDLNSLKGHVKLSREGLSIIDLSIKSPGSSIYAPRFNLVTKEFTDFKDFVDKVRFDAQLNKSRVALSEVAYFAPALEGMNDTIQLSTVVSKEVKKLRLSKFNLRYKEKTQVNATINLPDFRNIDAAFFQEKIQYAFIDLEELQSLKMPNTFKGDYIKLDKNTNRLSYFVAEDIKLDGFSSQFVLEADRISTHLGAVRMNNGLMFTKNEDGSFEFQQSTASSYDLKIEQFNLGQFLGNKQLGIVDGFLFLSGVAFSSSNLEFYSIEGEINRFDFMNYPYSNISINEARMMDNSFEGTIEVDDENICLHYNGIVDFKHDLHFDFAANIDGAKLDNLHLSQTPNSETIFTTTIRMDMAGTGVNDFAGNITLDDLYLDEKEKGEDKNLKIPSLIFDITRSELEDVFSLQSNVLDARLKGKIDFVHLMDDLNHQMRELFPSLTDVDDRNKIDSYNKSENFTFQLDVKDAEGILDVFMPSLRLAPATNLLIDYHEELDNYAIQLNSNYISYTDFVFKSIDLNQKMGEGALSGYLNLSQIKINDSTSFSNVFYNDQARNDSISSELTWGKDSTQLSKLIWDTKISSWEDIDVLIHPSEFSFRGFEWNLKRESDLAFRKDTISIDQFELVRGEQSIFLEGRMSKSESDKLFFEVKKVDLNEISSILQLKKLAGEINASGAISTVFDDFQFFGEASIDELYVLDELVGNIVLESKWIQEKKSIELKGDLEYRNTETLQFTGNYYTKRENNNLDFFLNFENTDIHFVNAFMNPMIVSNIGGHLNGKVKVTGSPNEPKLEGVIDLGKGSAKVEMFGTNFTLDGPIVIDESGFYINSVPLYDEEGNAGSVVGAVLHDNFRNFNFDLQIDIEDDAINRDPLKPWVPLKLETFLVLNTKSTLDAAYYGKAYATGTVNLFGYTDNLEITVNLKTRKGTEVSIPMYGVSEIEDESFIVFVDDMNDSTDLKLEPKIDFTGVNLDLNFEVTPDATIKIVFDEDVEDEIIAKGKGDVNLNLNSLGDITMDGLFTVSNGFYDFTLGPIKKKFFIEEGGTISWSGDPYNALLDLKTYYRVNANIATLTNNQLGQGSGSRQPVLCYLELSESLIKPKIDFDIQAPNADDISQSLITRIQNDPDELSRQFFSLLLWRRFQPLTGTSSTDGSAALELIANQINALLSKMSTDYALNIDLTKDQLTGDNSYEFGLKKGFLDDKLILTGSFGVENQKIDKETSENHLIGDVRLEYLINEQGTFRVNVFNESNDRSVVSVQDQGDFTQGVGLSYKESFNTVDDFRVIQKFFNLFRKEEDRRLRKKKKLVRVPEENE